MQQLKCTHCDGERLCAKEIEFRKINVKSMALASLEKVLEVTCLDCEHVGILDAEVFSFA